MRPCPLHPTHPPGRQNRPAKRQARRSAMRLRPTQPCQNHIKATNTPSCHSEERPQTHRAGEKITFQRHPLRPPRPLPSPSGRKNTTQANGSGNTSPPRKRSHRKHECRQVEHDISMGDKTKQTQRTNNNRTPRGGRTIRQSSARQQSPEQDAESSNRSTSRGNVSYGFVYRRAEETNTNGTV